MTRVTCADCAYDLTGLDPEWDCPECGLAIRESTDRPGSPFQCRPSFDSWWRTGSLVCTSPSTVLKQLDERTLDIGDRNVCAALLTSVQVGACASVPVTLVTIASTVIVAALVRRACWEQDDRADAKFMHLTCPLAILSVIGWILGAIITLAMGAVLNLHVAATSGALVHTACLLTGAAWVLVLMVRFRSEI